MTKNLLKVISLVTLISLSGCTGNTSSTTSNTNSNGGSTSSNSSLVAPEGTIIYKVQVLLPNGEKAGEGLQVQWCDDVNCISANTDANGVATQFLKPNTYDVHVFNFGETYACELGIKSSKDTPSIEVKLHDVLNYNGGNGSKDNPYVVNEGVYNITLSNIDTEAKVAEEVFVGFVPIRPGKYIIESWSDTTDTINPKVGYYGNNPHYIPENPIGDMVDDDSGDTDNFRLEFNIALEEFVNTGEVDEEGNMIYEKDANGNYISGGIFRFGIGASEIRREKSFPIIIKYLEHYEAPKVIAEEMEVTETLTKCDNALTDTIWKDCEINGLDTAVYNEADGKYHLDDADGYVLYAKISQPCSYIDKAFTEVEDSGSNALTLDNGTKDYTSFIDKYAENCNDDGVYPVTNELKTFLEYYYLASEMWILSVSETIVADGSGWLFAVGYYADLADFYDKPIGGIGTEEEAYLIEKGSYLAEVSANNTVYYTFGPKNQNIETIYRVKSSEENIEFVGLDTYNVTVQTNEDEKYFDITLGDQNNSVTCVFGIKTVDNSEAKLEFVLENREKTVECDALALGANTVEVVDGYVECSFTAPKDGVFTVTSNEENAYFYYDGSSYDGSKGVINFSFECTKDQVVKFDICTIDGNNDFISFNISSLKIGSNSISVQANEEVEELFFAPEDGTYQVTVVSKNTLVVHVDNNVFSNYYQGDSFDVELKAGESLDLIVMATNNKKGTIVLTITKL